MFAVINSLSNEVLKEFSQKTDAICYAVEREIALHRETYPDYEYEYETDLSQLPDSELLDNSIYEVKKAVYRIRDNQLNEVRDEEYESKEEAQREFTNYWRGIALDDWSENFCYDDYKERHNISKDKVFSEEEELEIARKDLASMTDKEIMDYFEFEVIKQWD